MAGPPTYSKHNAAGEQIANVNRYSDTQDAALRTALGGVAVTNELSPRTLMFASATMLKHAEPILILEKFAQPHPMPANKSQTIKMRRPKPFPPALTPLVEGVTPDAQKMSYEDVQASLSQYGAWLELTDVIQDTHEDPILRDMSMLCGEQAGETKEQLMWGILKGATNVFYAGGVANTAAVVSGLTIQDFRNVIRTLQRNKAKPITKILNPSANISTKFVEAGYVAIGHTDLEPDLRAMNTVAPGTFTPVAGYGSRSPISEYEVGTVERTRIILSPEYQPTIDAGGAPATGKLLSAGGAKADIYDMIFLAQDCFGTVPLKGKDSIKSFVLNPGSARGSDPLGQRGSVGWKTWFCSLILNQAWMARLQTGAVDLTK